MSVDAPGPEACLLGATFVLRVFLAVQVLMVESGGSEQSRI